MSTRRRAIIVSTITSILVIMFLFDTDFFGYQSVVSSFPFAYLWLKIVPVSLIAIVLYIGVMWVLFFKGRGVSRFSIGMFPSVALTPYLLSSESITESIFSDLGRVSLIIVSALICWIFIYLLILTANVVNGYVIYNIPLGQAGKAAQFIFSLIASYILILLLFGTGTRIELRIPLIFIFVFFYSFSCIWTLQLRPRQLWVNSIVISIIIAFAAFTLSLWPITAAYASMILVIFLYILLNMALETRENISSTMRVEYALLLVLVVMILFINAQWGINGTIF